MKPPVSTAAICRVPSADLFLLWSFLSSIHPSLTYLFSGLLSFLSEQERDGLPDLVKILLFCFLN